VRPPAEPPLACSTYLQSIATGDTFVLEIAARIAGRLIASTWSTPAMETDQDTNLGTGRKGQVLRQIQRSCKVVPRMSVQTVVTSMLHAAIAAIPAAAPAPVPKRP
jgi:hypothetical protein